MDTILLARLQFTITTVYHFFFVPLTLGLSILVAVMQTAYFRTGDDLYKRMTKFWGKLFLINFSIGVVTGIVQEFQFGMNWSEYSRFTGDIFGIPLAIEALMAFFLESTFMGIWIFGWDRLSRGVHLASIWLVALGSNISALWILIANSFMHQPVGYVIRNGRAELTDFFAILGNPHVWVQWPHVFTSALTTAAFFVLAISAWHLLKANGDVKMFKRSFQIASVTAISASIAVAVVGHAQAQHMIEAQPMKMAAAEALWDTEDPASMSLFTIGNEAERRDVFAIRVPGLLSLLAYNRIDGAVPGINELQDEYEAAYGPGNYVPPVAISYWTFRIMVGLGMLMIALAIVVLWATIRNNIEGRRKLLAILPYTIVLPYAANTTGWLFTEIGRQPWLVFGLMTLEEGISPIPASSALFSLIAYFLTISVLVSATLYLMNTYARRDPMARPQREEAPDDLPSLLTQQPAK